MKKTLLYSLAAFVGLSFMSCSGDYDDWMAPQHNDQDSAITIPGFTASAAGDVNLANRHGCEGVQPLYGYAA